MQIKITLALLGLVSSAAANPYCNQNNCYRGLLRINEQAPEGQNPATDACHEYFDKCDHPPNDHLTTKCSNDLPRYLAACRCLFGNEEYDPKGEDPIPLFSCPEGTSCCGGSCKDLLTDVQNCGTCGKSCGEGETCCGGTCKNLKNDKDSCGACGTKCKNGEACCNGWCKDILSSEWNCGACDSKCYGNGKKCCSGSCKDTKNDKWNCGSCNNKCEGHKGDTCCSGSCEDTKKDEKHCGGCDKVCPWNKPKCSSGLCYKPVKGW